MTTHQPIVSVVIPNWNGAEFLEETLDSVFAQTFDGFEVVVVDDGSTDNSVALIKRYAAQHENLRLIERASSGGVSQARNVGIQAAKGRYVAFLDADDVWHPNKLALQVRALELNPEARCCFSKFKPWHPENGIYPPATQLFGAQPISAEDINETLSGYIYHQMIMNVWMWTTTVMLEKRLLDEVGLFDPALPRGEDYDLWLRITWRYKVLQLNSVLALYRREHDSITRRPSSVAYEAEVLKKFIDAHGLEGPDGEKTEDSDLRRRLHKIYINHGAMCLRHQMRHEARRSFSNALANRLNVDALVGWGRSWL